MSVLQTTANVLVALNRETTVGVAATATGATRLRFISSQGLELKRAAIQSTEKRPDGLTPMGRIGGKSVEGNYSTELTTGGATDILLEAVMRSAWVTATSVGFATMTTVAIGTNTVTANAGDWVGAQGVRVGDIFTITGTTVSGDNNVNAMVLAVTSLTITTTPATFTTLVASATGTITFAKKLISPATITRYSHTIEQYDADIDLSAVYLGCRCTGAKLSFKPGAMATAQYTFLGLDRIAETTGTSPFFTSPTLTTGLAMIADDSSITYNGSKIATFTGFDLDFTITAKGEPVIGSFVSPDVFDNNLMVTGTITGLRSDFSNLTLYDAETEFGVSIMLQDPSTTPKGFLGVYLPRVKISALSAPVGGGDGAKVESLTLMVGPKIAATGFDAGIAVFSSSAP